MLIDWFPTALRRFRAFTLSTRRQFRHVRRIENCSAEIQSLEARQLLAADLVPYQPSGWSDKIVVSTQKDTHTDAPAFIIGDYNYYFDAAFANFGNAGTVPFQSTLTLDGSNSLTINSAAGLGSGFYAFVEDVQLNSGFLSAGVHSVTLNVDSLNAVDEGAGDTNNTYTRNINVGLPAASTSLSIPTADILTAIAGNWLETPGTIATGVSNLYSFTLANPSGLFLDIDSRDIASPLSGTLDAAMALYDSAGNIVATNDNGFDFRGFAAPATAKTTATASGFFDPDIYADLPAGTYYLAVAGASSTSGNYLLHALADSNYSASVPALNSNPGAAGTFYLDFDGHSATDAWGTYAANPYSLDGNASTYSPGERLAIQNLWRATSEDFSPFNVNVSTVDPGSFNNGQALRMVITNSSPSLVGQSSGTLGYAYLGSYNNPAGPNDNVAFTFASEFDSFNGFGAGLDGKIMAGALDQAGTVSHELGHTLGLKHYNTQSGNFAGNASIIPNALMATPNTGVLRQTWETGNADAGSPNVIAQDDVAVISNGTNAFGYRADDYADSSGTATTLSPSGGLYSARGIISSTTDKDYFKFATSGVTTLTVDVDEFVNNLNTQFTLYQSDGVTPVATIDPSNSFDSTLTQDLPAGNYYIAVSSHGASGEIGQYSLRINLTNNAPTITSNGSGTSASINIFENTTAVTTVTASDPDAGSTLTYSLAGGADASLFSINPTTGILTFIAAPDFDNPADSNTDNVYQVTVQVSDGSLTDTQDLSVTVNNVSEAPVITDRTVAGKEDLAYTFTVADFGFADPNDSPANALLSVIVNRPTAGALRYNGVAVSSTVTIPAADITAGKLTFTPVANARGATYATFSFQVRDDGGTANGGVNTSTAKTMTIDLTPVADNPTVTNTSTFEDTKTTAGLVVTRNAVDGTEVAWVKITNITNGTLYKNGGTTVISNNTFITYDEAHAGLKFMPAANLVSPSAAFNFKVQASITNDDTGLGGNVLTASITVTAVNDAPVLLTTGIPSLFPIAEDVTTAANTGTPISTIIANLTNTGGKITDDDLGALQGIAVTSLDVSHGTWQYTLNNGTDWTDFGATSASAARLLASIAGTKVRFLPNADFNGTATFLFAAWDQTAGTNGSTAVVTNRGGSKAFSLATQNAIVTVTPVNDAPVFDPAGSPTLTTIAANISDVNNTGTLVSQIINNLTVTGGKITDIDVGALRGIAITSADQAHGTWQFTIDNGTNWNNFGTPSASTALLLASVAGTKIRFIPNPGFVGNANFVFVAWDQSSGTNGGTASASSRGGTKPFSLGYDTAVISVQIVNNAPVLNTAGAPAIPDVDSNLPASTNNGMLTSDLIISMAPGGISDIDAGALQGIAVTSADQTHGTWQFSTNDGANWTNFGTPSAAAARLLASVGGTRVRFVPTVGYVGNATFVFVAWDQSSGVNGNTGVASNRGGATSYSTNYETATIKSKFTNHAPVMTDGTPTLTAINRNVPNAGNPGTLVADIIASITSTGGSFTDPDVSPVQGIAVTTVDQSNGTWQYSINDGTNWLNFGSPTAATARLLASDAATRIRFIPNSNFVGQATFDFVAWDQTAGTNGNTGVATNRGNATAFSSFADTASINIQYFNNAPVLDNSGTPRLPDIDDDISDAGNTGALVTEIISAMGPNRITDLDTFDPQGIAITATSSTNGIWQYSLDNGTNWSAIGAVSDSSARLLAADSQTRVRFVPVTMKNQNYTATITFRAWDQFSGTNGALADTSVNGGTTPFSTATESAAMTVRPS